MTTPLVDVAPPPAGTRATSWVARWNVSVIALVALTYLVLAWQRRWISDDGLIVSRTVRQVLAGHGPVFNVGERVEANTSTLWTYLLVAVDWVTGTDTALLAVVLGVLLSVLGLALGMDASRRLQVRACGSQPAPLMVPLGAFLVLALPPFWDFASSGLETGLTFAWLGGSYWALVQNASTMRRLRSSTGTAALLGLAPLVRPELAVVGISFLMALWWCSGCGVRRALKMCGAAAVVPLLYQVFRMGYYGLVVPQTAIAKEAGSALWGRGLTYLGDFVGPYALWFPLGLVLTATVALAGRSRGATNGLPLLLAPLVPGLLLTAYVLRLGGDFMHARMLLPALFLLILPSMLVRVPTFSTGRRTTTGRVLPVAIILATACWSLVCGTSLRPSYSRQVVPLEPGTGIADERQFWVNDLHARHPVTAQAYTTGFPNALHAVAAARLLGPGGVVWNPGGAYEVLQPRTALPWSFVLVMVNLGTAGELVRLDEAVLDPLGLSYPLAAHAQLAVRSRPGHEKRLPDSFVLADATEPGTVLPSAGPSAREVNDARRALQCGDIAELQAAARSAMTPHRFWSNVAGAVHRTSFRIPLSPAAAVAVSCRSG